MDVSHVWGKTEALEYLKAVGTARPMSRDWGMVFQFQLQRCSPDHREGDGSRGGARNPRAVAGSAGLTDIRLKDSNRSIWRACLPYLMFGNGPISCAMRGCSHPFNASALVPSDVVAFVSLAGMDCRCRCGLATARDLALFVRDLRDGGVVSAAALRRMRRSGRRTTPTRTWARACARPVWTRATHRVHRQRVGIRAAVGWIPGEDVVIALLTNVGAMHAGNSVLSGKAAERVGGHRCSARGRARTCSEKPGFHARSAAALRSAFSKIRRTRPDCANSRLGRRGTDALRHDRSLRVGRIASTMRLRMP